MSERRQHEPVPLPRRPPPTAPPPAMAPHTLNYHAKGSTERYRRPGVGDPSDLPLGCLFQLLAFLAVMTLTFCSGITDRRSLGWMTFACAVTTSIAMIVGFTTRR